MKLTFAFAPAVLLWPFLWLDGVNRHVMTRSSGLILCIYGVVLIIGALSALFSKRIQMRVLAPNYSPIRFRAGLLLFGLFGLGCLFEGAQALQQFAQHHTQA